MEMHGTLTPTGKLPAIQFSATPPMSRGVSAVQSLSAEVLEITRDSDAFAGFKAAIHDLIEFFRDELPTVIRMASGRMPCEPNPSMEDAAVALFNEMESKIENKVEIAKFQF